LGRSFLGSCGRSIMLQVSLFCYHTCSLLLPFILLPAQKPHNQREISFKQGFILHTPSESYPSQPSIHPTLQPPISSHPISPSSLPLPLSPSQILPSQTSNPSPNPHHYLSSLPSSQPSYPLLTHLTIPYAPRTTQSTIHHSTDLSNPTIPNYPRPSTNQVSQSLSVPLSITHIGRDPGLPRSV